MKAGYLALAAAISTGVNGKLSARRHGHEAFHLGARHVNLTTAEASCGCTTIYTTITGAGTLWFPPPAATPSSSVPAAAPTTTSISTTTELYTATVYPSPVVPTPLATTCPTPGVYTIPATTVTLTESTTVCAAVSTSVPAGTYTAGGVTTTVTELTTVTCPYASVSTSGTVVTSVILTTTYVCPSSGTYTIAPQTTVCETETVWVYPTPASYAPGTYTQPEVVTTITETDVVIFCPFTSSEAAAPTSAPVVAAAVPTSAAPVVVAAAPTSAPVVVASSAPAAPVSNAAGYTGKAWSGITYTPYTDSGACKPAGDVASDIQAIANAGFSAVRVYSTDCSTLQNVGSACATYGLKIILGVFVDESGCGAAQSQVAEIAAWAQWNLVEFIVVGNECVFNNYASAGELSAFIASAKSQFASAGYTGQCTTTEPLDVWQSNAGTLCANVDLVACNIHPFFNAATTAEGAGDFVASQLAIVDSLCSGKSGMVTETGWPSAGTGCNGAACPGDAEQATAVKAIQDAVGGKSVAFSYTNDLWKAAGDFGCEQSWGAIHLFQ